MATIVDTQSTAQEIIISTPVSTTEFVIKHMHENVEQNWVQVEVELGPFTTETRPDGSTEKRGTSRRNIRVWEGDAYLAVRDTWTNADLLTILPTLIV
jgi:hypothetical protein